MDPLTQTRVKIERTADPPAAMAAAPVAEGSHELAFQVLENLPLAAAWFAVEEGRAVYANRAFRNLFSQTAEQIQSWSQWSSILADASRSRPGAPRRQTEPLSKVQPDFRAGQGAGISVEIRPDIFLDISTLNSSALNISGLDISGLDISLEPVELSLRGSDGAELTVVQSGVVLPGRQGTLVFYEDLSARRRDELRLAEAEQGAREREVLYPILLNHTHETVVLASADGTRSFVSPSVTAMLGWSQGEYLAQSLEELVHPEDRPAVLAARERCNHGATAELLRYRSLRKDGSWLWVEAFASCYKDPATDRNLGYLATLRDGSERHAKEAELAARTAMLERQARLDHLTGIANRRTFDAALRDEARWLSRRTQALGLLLMDVDHFKRYNDHYGHLEGDRVLRRVAERLRASVNRTTDLVARFGGEEFVLLLPMTDAEGAVAVAQAILQAVAGEAIPHVESPFGVVTLSIGVAWWTASTPLDRDQLLLHADQALYQAKAEGRNRVCVEQWNAAPGDAGQPQPAAPLPVQLLEQAHCTGQGQAPVT